MTEQLLILAFTLSFGIQIGRVLTERRIARKTVEGIEALLNHNWLAPQILAARIHQDQEAIEVPEFKPSLTLRCRMIHESVRSRNA